MSATTSLSSPARPASRCPICDDSGWQSTGPALSGAPLRLVECRCGLVARRRAEVETQRRAERAQRYLLELRAGLGKLADRTFDNFDPERLLLSCSWSDQTISATMQRQNLYAALRAARTYAAAPTGWLYLYGPPGAGKSHLAAAIANELATAGEPVGYASVPDLLGFVKRGMDDNTADDRFEGVRAADCLVLDDFGTENMTGWSVETMFRLIDKRDALQLTTVITSNLHHDSLHPRIASRLAGMVTLVPMLISDYRRLPR